jgi:hypothetical protein
MAWRQPFAFTTFEGETITSADLLGQGRRAELLGELVRSLPRRGRTAGGHLASRTGQRHCLPRSRLSRPGAGRLAYLAEFDITYPSGPDLQSAAARRYGIKGVPETFFIDPQGKITDIVIGPIVSQAKMDEYLNKIRP